MISINDFMNKGIVFAFLSEGDRVSFRNDNLIVSDRLGAIKHQSTCYRIFALFLIGDLTITSGMIQRSHKFGFPIILMTGAMRVYDVIGSRNEGNFELRKMQYCYEKIDIARHIVKNKISNQAETLRLQRSMEKKIRDAIVKLDGYAAKADDIDDPVSLMGLEGAASQTYFENNFNTCSWSGRMPRLKRDYVNSTLDIGYTILFNIIDSMLKSFGFDTYWGVYHKQFFMRKSLVCDLVEPFRTLIDWRVRKSINLGQCKPEHFTVLNGRNQLNWEFSKDYVKFLSAPIIERREDIYLYFRSYYRAFMKEKDIEEYPVFSMRD